MVDVVVPARVRKRRPFYHSLQPVFMNCTYFVYSADRVAPQNMSSSVNNTTLMK